MPLQHRSSGWSWLVLGVQGFIGHAVRQAVEGASHYPVGVDCVDGKDVLVVDVCDTARLEALVRELQPAVVIDAVRPPAATPEPALGPFFVHSTRSVLQAVQAGAPASRVLLLGSAAEYGNAPCGSWSSEGDAARPLSSYGRAKCDQFDVARAFRKRGLTVTTARVFNTVGPGQGSNHFVGSLLDRIRRGQIPLQVPHGNHVRDWIDVRDVADALVTLGTLAAPPEVVNVCSGEGRTLAVVAEQVATLASVRVEVASSPAVPSVLWRSVGNPEKLLAMGWRPRHGWRDSLLDQCRY